MTLPEFLQKLRNRPKLFVLRRVMGESMLPTLVPDKVVFGVRSRRVRAGDVVIVRHGELDKIKRVKEVRAGEIFLAGDNSLHSTDSRDFGWLALTAVIARVVWPNVARIEN